MAAPAQVEPARPERLAATAVKANPDSFILRVQALVWLRAGKTEDAMRQLVALLEQPSPLSPGLVRLLIALSHHKLGHKEDARRAYEQAVKDGIPVSHVHETLEYQVLLIEAHKAIEGKD